MSGEEEIETTIAPQPPRRPGIRSELPLPPAAPPGEYELIRQIGKGEIGTGEALVLMDYFDRKERRERRLEREDKEHNTPPQIPSANEIGQSVAKYIKEAGVLPTAGKPEEMPPWAKEHDSQLTEILKTLRGDEEAKKLQEAVNKQLSPVKHELEKATEKIKELTSRPTSPVEGRKTRLEEYIQTRKDLKEAGIIQEGKETSGSLMLLNGKGNPMQGIPVSGRIPALVVYLPYIIESLANSIEQRIDRIAEKYDLVPPKAPEKEKKELIILPPKPIPEVVEPPTTEPAAKPILEIPEKPRPKVEGTEEAETHIEESAEAPEIKPKVKETPKKKPVALQKVCAKCNSSVTEIETPKGTRYRCSECKKFTKIKEIKKSGGNTKPTNN